MNFPISNVCLCHCSQVYISYIVSIDVAKGSFQGILNGKFLKGIAGVEWGRFWKRIDRDLEVEGWKGKSLKDLWRYSWGLWIGGNQLFVRVYFIESMMFIQSILSLKSMEIGLD